MHSNQMLTSSHTSFVTLLQFLNNSSFLKQKSVSIQLIKAEKTFTQQLLPTIDDFVRLKKYGNGLRMVPSWKKQLIESLQKVNVSGEKGKIAKLQGIEGLLKYCQLKQLNFKDLCKDLLIKEINPLKKTIKYREKSQINHIISTTISSLSMNLHQGQVQIKYNDAGNGEKKEVYQFGKKLIVNNENYRNIVLLWDFQTANCFENGSKQLNKLISSFKLFLMMSKWNKIGAKRLKDSLVICSQSRSLIKYTRSILNFIQKGHQNTINASIKSFSQLRKYANIKNIQIIQTYLQFAPINRQFDTKRCVEQIKKYMESGIAGWHYEKAKQNKYILMLQSNMRACINWKRYLRREEQGYLQKQRILREQNIEKYSETVNKINKLLGLKNGYIGYGVQCYIWMANINSWSNCEQFCPSKIINIFQKALDNRIKQTIIKITMQETQLKIVRADSKVFSIGLNYQTHRPLIEGATFVTDDKLSGFWIDSHSRLYAKGNNQYGQLGLGNISQNIDKWEKIKIKQKVKHFDSRAKRSICVTQGNQIYQWGYFDGQIHHNPVLLQTPLFLKGKNIIAVSCGFIGFFAICEEGNVYNLQKGIVKTMKKDLDRRILITTGNSLLEITYAVGIKVNCYDQVKKKNILKWFKDSYGSINKTEQQFLVGDENSEFKSNRIYAFSEPVLI